MSLRGCANLVVVLGGVDCANLAPWEFPPVCVEPDKNVINLLSLRLGMENTGFTLICRCINVQGSWRESRSHQP